MKELNHYDIAAQNFYGKLNLKSFPLDSLDWYGLYFDKITKGGKDIQIFDALADKYEWDSKPSVNNELFNKDHVIVVTDSNLKIVHATNNISQLNGYSITEILGKSPRMFQGEGTCPKARKYISDAVKKQVPFETVLLNYRKDGTPYNCWINGKPVFNRDGKLVHFIAYEKEVA